MSGVKCPGRTGSAVGPGMQGSSREGGSDAVLIRMYEGVSKA